MILKIDIEADCISAVKLLGKSVKIDSGKYGILMCIWLNTFETTAGFSSSIEECSEEEPIIFNAAGKEFLPVTYRYSLWKCPDGEKRKIRVDFEAAHLPYVSDDGKTWSWVEGPYE